LLRNAIAANANADPGHLSYIVDKGSIKNVWVNTVEKMIRCFNISRWSVTLMEHSGLKFNKNSDFQNPKVPIK